MENQTLQKLIQNQNLPLGFEQTVEQWYKPLVKDIAAIHQGDTLIIGVQGSQGCGKSTLALFCKYLLENTYKLNTVVLSLDDFYLRLAERKQLAADIHPLQATRGVPSTHDVELAIHTIKRLSQQKNLQTTELPRFNKAIDDRAPESEWDNVTGAVDVILFEGWCVGATPQANKALIHPVNKLEASEDPHGDWRNHVNTALAGQYQQLFNRIDKLLVLNAPSFECVYQWRWLQEQKLTEKTRRENPNTPTRLLSEAGVKRFISHYERLTRHCLSTLPAQADWVLDLNKHHAITTLSCREDLQFLLLLRGLV